MELVKSQKTKGRRGMRIGQNISTENTETKCKWNFQVLCMEFSRKWTFQVRCMEFSRKLEFSSFQKSHPIYLKYQILQILVSVFVFKTEQQSTQAGPILKVSRSSSTCQPWKKTHSFRVEKMLYTRFEWRRCYKYTHLEWERCYKYTRFEWKRCHKYTRFEWERCHKYTRFEWEM
jgi:hypothetical protein